jgi:hypothetical protein
MHQLTSYVKYWNAITVKMTNILFTCYLRRVSISRSIILIIDYVINCLIDFDRMIDATLLDISGIYVVMTTRVTGRREKSSL